MKKANEKVLYIVSGVNGAGKSTFVKHAMSNFKNIYLNADEMAKQKYGGYSTKANRAAGYEVLKTLQDTAKLGVPIIWETTLGSKTYFKICELYRNHHYIIDLTYIFLENEEAHRKRIDERVANGGHNINDAVLTKRFNDRSVNFEKAIEVADSWKMLCNQKPWIELVAFGNGNIKMISNQELYKDFYDLTPNKSPIIEKFRKIIGFSIKHDRTR